MMLTVMTSRERLLLKTLGRLTGARSLRDDRLKIWLIEVRKLPADIDTKTIQAVMKWAVEHEYWTTRSVNMGTFVFFFEEIYDQYRGELRQIELKKNPAKSFLHGYW